MKTLKKEPRVVILPEILGRIKKYTELSKENVYWMGIVEEGLDSNCQPNDVYYIIDSEIVKQEVKGKCVNINSEDLEEYCVSNTLDSAYCIPAIALGRVVGNKPVEITNADIKMIKDIGYDGLVIYILTNKRNEVGMYLLDLYKDIMYDEIALEIESSSDKTDNDIIKEISEKVSARDLKKIYEERKKTINTKNDNDVKIEIRGNTTTSNNSTKTTKTENKEEYIPSELVEKSPSFLDLIVSKLTVNNKEGEA